VGSSLHIGIRCFFKEIKPKKIKVKNLFFYLPESKEGVYLQPQKQRRFLIKTGVVFKVLLRMESFKKKSKIFLKKIWRVKKKHCIFAAAYSANKFPKILKRNPGWVIR
jgi:hypothetical protein